MIDKKQKKSQNSSMSATNFVMYQKMKQLGSRYSERVTMKEEESYHHALAREYFRLGNQHQKSRQYKLSINFFLTALKYKYDSPEIHNNIGVVYVLNKEYQKAEQSFNKSIQNKLSQIFPKINLANLKFKQDKFTAGIQIFLQLLSVNKDKRIINHFSKVLVSHNNFYRFFKFNLMASHPNIDKQALECSTEYIMENISKDSPILLEPQESLPATTLKEAQIQEIQKVFNIIHRKYSSMKFMKNRSQLNQTSLHGQELARCIQGLNSQKASNITKLLFMYIFMEEQKTDLSLFFYTLIDKFEDKQILKEYKQLYENYIKIKNEQNVPFHWHYSVVISKQSTEKRRQIVESIERFFFREKLPVFRLHQIRNWKSLPDGQRTLQILAKTFQDLENYQQISALAFSQLQKYGCTFDYDLQAAVSQYFVHRYKSLDQGRQMILSVSCNSLNDGDFSQDKKFKDFEWMIVMLHLRKQFQRAIQTCNKKLAQFQFPDKEDKMEQYIGCIYLTVHHYQKAFEHLKIAYKINPNNHNTNHKLACLHFLLLSFRRQNAKKVYKIEHDQEYFQPEVQQFLWKQYQKSLQYILHAISIDPTKIKDYYLLEMLYQFSYYKDEKIKLHLNKLLKESSRPKDFKVRANIAIFNLMTFQFDKSYQYFRSIIDKGLSKVDTNCQDVELIYFIRKCCDATSLLTLDYEQFGWACQIGLYLVIFYHNAELFEKYDQNSHQLDAKYFQFISKHFERAIELPVQLANRLERLDDDHKKVIYRYIFEDKNLKRYAVDLLRLYEKIRQVQPSRQSLFYFQTQVNVKQYKIAALKELFDYIINFEDSMARNEYYKKSYLVLLSQIIKDQCKKPTKIRKSWTDVNIQTRFTYYITESNPQLFLSLKFSQTNNIYKLADRELINLILKSIWKIRHQHTRFRKVHKDKKEFRASTLYQGIILLTIEEVLPYIEKNKDQQKNLAANCQQFLTHQNTNKFLAQIASLLYEQEDYQENKSEINPFPERSVLGQSKMSNLSDLSSASPDIQKCLDYKYPFYNYSPQKDARSDLSKSQYEQMMNSHLRQEDLFQLLCQINNQDIQDDKDGKRRLFLFKQIVNFVKNCEELDILVTNLHKRCDKQDCHKFSIQCSQLIKIGPNNKKFTSDKRLFGYTCDILKQIMDPQQKKNESSLSYDQTSFAVLQQDMYFSIISQNVFEGVINFLQVIKKQSKQYHLKMLQDMHQQLFHRQHQYSKKLKFYMKLLMIKKINYEKFLGLIQTKLIHD